MAKAKKENKLKLKTEHKLLLGGSILSLFIIYLTKFDTTPASSLLIYNLGQYLWFNLSISYLGSIIFYLIVVYIPARRKRKLFLFQMWMDVMMLHSKAWMLFFHLRNAAKMENEIPDTGNIMPKDVDKMLGLVNLETIHTFTNEPGTPTQSFRIYLEKYKPAINNSINNTLAIPYEDSELSLILLQLQRTSIITGIWLERNGNKIGGHDMLLYYIHLERLDKYCKKHLAPPKFGGKKFKTKKTKAPKEKH